MKRLLSIFSLFISLGAVCQPSDTGTIKQGRWMDHTPFMDSVVKQYIAESKGIVDTGAVTFSKVYRDVKSGLEGLAKGLKAPVEHVYQIIVRQQVIYSIIYSLFLISFIIFCILGWRLIRFMMKTNNDVDENPGPVIICVISWIIALICLIVFLCNLSETVTGFINPEYGALKDIAGFVK